MHAGITASAPGKDRIGIRGVFALSGLAAQRAQAQCEREASSDPQHHNSLRRARSRGLREYVGRVTSRGETFVTLSKVSDEAFHHSPITDHQIPSKNHVSLSIWRSNRRLGHRTLRFRVNHTENDG